VARPAFIRLAAGLAAALGLGAALLGSGTFAWVGVGLALSSAIARVGAPLAVAAAFWIVAGANALGWPSALIGAASLGGISSEMLLGHWFLVDPKLPRWPLRRLAYFGIAGIAAEGVRVAVLPNDGLIATPLVLALLAALTLLLMIGVVLSLRVRSYTGVMAATGLSYLATITALAVAIISRPAA
ncbi:MAG TPA: hypothetical protein VJ935_02730, partial [Acidimicrobiia bacterium]|nr:hypothetical protein [Acidimicrobiia bacterium]